MLLATRLTRRCVNCCVALSTLLGFGCSSPERKPPEASLPDATAVDCSRNTGQFVQTCQGSLTLDTGPLRFAGANNYTLGFGDDAHSDRVLRAAQDAGFSVLRIPGFFETGTLDSQAAIRPRTSGEVYTQYWNAVAAQPAFNDGEDGLLRLDHVLAQAGAQGQKLVISLVNNWPNFGGMDQYVRWAQVSYHDEFYTNDRIREWYRAWVTHVINRVNSVNGVRYGDDPAIAVWELANEPRCSSDGVYPRSSACTTSTITSWARDMAAFVRTLEPQQLIAVGDEGFFCDPGSSDALDDCSAGVDSRALGAIEDIDVLSFHLYPEFWGRDVNWGQSWIERHAKLANELGKPIYLGEFGYQDRSLRNPVFKSWTDTVADSGISGALVWSLAGTDENGISDPDYDQMSVYCPSPVCTALGNFARAMNGQSEHFAPVADHDFGTTAPDTTVVLRPAVNDVSYAGTRIAPESLDLDPNQPDQQVQVALNQGRFELTDAGEVQFTPDAGFTGYVEIATTSYDDLGAASAPARLGVTVDDPARLLLHSFEAGTEGFAVPSWSTARGTLEASAQFATEGSFSLKLVPTVAGWFGHVLSEPVDLSNKTTISWDVRTGSSPVKSEIALQSGASWLWCDGGTWVTVPAATERMTLSADLRNLTCDGGGLFEAALVRGVYLYADGLAFYDNVRVE